MSQIDHEMEQIGRRGGALARFSSVATFAAPDHGALTNRSRAEPLLPRAWHALHAAVRPAADAISTWLERARMRRHLMMLDDRLLRDIGLTRLQVRKEAEKPFWRV
jgi:uncharacterized protein YjiS (DUF1127 family)